jgi:hypothetical protein
MKKIIRNDLVAVIISPTHGAGWYSWHDVESLLYDPAIVSCLEVQDYDSIEAYLTENYPNKYFPKPQELKVIWIPVGARFRIDEYDGSESLILERDEVWLTA